MKPAKSSPSARTLPARGGQLSRKERRELARRIQSDNVTLEIVHANAAGIDVGKDTHYEAVPPDRDAKPVQCFASCTEGLQPMVAWLNETNVRLVDRHTQKLIWSTKKSKSWDDRLADDIVEQLKRDREKSFSHF